jgi:transposase
MTDEAMSPLRRRMIEDMSMRRLPESFGPYTTCYNRFVRWRRAAVWDQIMRLH